MKVLFLFSEKLIKSFEILNTLIYTDFSTNY